MGLPDAGTRGAGHRLDTDRQSGEQCHFLRQYHHLYHRFNRGIRAYYFGLAASGWLLSPLLLSILAVLILLVLYRRDYRSAALGILRRQR